LRSSIGTVARRFPHAAPFNNIAERIILDTMLLNGAFRALKECVQERKGPLEETLRRVIREELQTYNGLLKKLS